MTRLCAGHEAVEIVEMARAAGANKVYMASAAPPVRYQTSMAFDHPLNKS